VFTARYGLIPCIKQIAFRLEKVNAEYNYFISNKVIQEECDKEENVAVTVGSCYFLFQKNTIQLSVQCHVFAQLQSDRHLNGNIQSKLRAAFDLCKNISLHCYLVTMVINIQSVRSQVCMYTHILHNIEMLVAQNTFKKWEHSECRVHKMARVPNVLQPCTKLSHYDSSSSLGCCCIW